MTNQEIVQNYESLVSLKKDNTIFFPAQVAYAITRNLRTLQPLYEDIINHRAQIIEANADPIDGEPGFFKPREGHEETLNGEIRALYQYDNETTISKITLNDLSRLNLSIANMDALYFMVDG